MSHPELDYHAIRHLATQLRTAASAESVAGTGWSLSLFEASFALERLLRTTGTAPAPPAPPAYDFQDDPEVVQAQRIRRCLLASGFGEAACFCAVTTRQREGTFWPFFYELKKVIPDLDDMYWGERCDNLWKGTT